MKIGMCGSYDLCNGKAVEIKHESDVLDHGDIFGVCYSMSILIVL